MPGEHLGPGEQPCATLARYPVSARSAQASPMRRSNGGPAPGNPRRAAALRQSEHVPLQAAGRLVTIAGGSGRWTRARTDRSTSKYPAICELLSGEATYGVMTLRDS
jgi:hypothetical protein